MPPNLAPPETLFEPEAISAPQVTTSKLIIAPPPTNQSTRIMIPSTSAPLEALHQVRPSTTKRARKSPKYLGFENDDLSGEPTKSSPPNSRQPRRKRRAGDVESVQHSVVQTILDTAAQAEPIPNSFPSPVIRDVSPTDP